MDDFWGQYIPAWIAAVASMTAVIAVYFAWRSLRRDEARERKAHAEGLSAWWAIRDGKWGVVLCNATDRTFHDIQISARGGWHADASADIPVTVIPPGTCFVRANSEAEKYPWQILNEEDSLPLLPVMYSKEHKVIRLDFTDSSGLRWSWLPDAGLREI